MKQNSYQVRISLYVFFFLIALCKESCIQTACTVTPAAPRIWDVAITIESVAEIVESKLCDLVMTISQDFFDTSTILQAIRNTISTASTKVTILDSEIDGILFDIDTIESKIDDIFNETTFIDQNLIDIRIDDFGGTWTALQALESTICVKFESAFDCLNTIESQIDQLSSDNLVQFIATFTKLQEVAIDIFDTMTTIQNLSNQISIELSAIDYLIISASSQLDVIANDICALGVTIEYDFSGTFTSIAFILNKLCDDISIINQVEIDVSNDFIDTFTTIDFFEHEMCIVDSKVDVLSGLANCIKSQLTNIIQ